MPHVKFGGRGLLGLLVGLCGEFTGAGLERFGLFVEDGDAWRAGVLGHAAGLIFFGVQTATLVGCRRGWRGGRLCRWVARFMSVEGRQTAMTCSAGCACAIWL